jgi:hypothetical protein
VNVYVRVVSLRRREREGPVEPGESTMGEHGPFKHFPAAGSGAAVYGDERGQEHHRQSHSHCLAAAE